MRNKTTRTVLYIIGGIAKISAALVTQCIKRTITKHTVKMFPRRIMARKIFTFSIFKKGKIVRTIPSKDADNAFREELETL